MPDAPPLDYRHTPDPRGPTFADAYICFAVGLILIWLSPNAWLFIGQKLGIGSGPGEVTLNGTVIPYLESVFFPGDAGIAMYTVAILVEGLVLAFSRGRATPLIATTLMIVVSLYNIGVVFWSMQNNVAYFINLLAAVFGIYAAMQIFSLYRIRKPMPVDPRSPASA